VTFDFQKRYSSAQPGDTVCAGREQSPPSETAATMVVMPHGAAGVFINLTPANSCGLSFYLKISGMCITREWHTIYGTYANQ
jgi:hypothetical protein